MVLARWQASIVDDAGNVLPGASVTVRAETSGNPLASLFSDRAGAVAIGNPFTADGDGFAAFHVAGGAYRIEVTSGAFSREWRYVGISLASESATIDASGNLILPADGYVDFTEAASAPGVPASNVARLYAYDEGGVTRLTYGNSSGIIRSIGERVFNVRDYGAVGDGVADDTVAINNAIASAEAVTSAITPPAGGFWGSVFLPQGVYLTSALTLTKPIRIYGQGRTSTVLKLKANANSSMFSHVLATSWFASALIEHLTLDGNKANQGAFFSSGITLVATSWTINDFYSLSVDLNDVAIHDFRDSGLFVGVNRNRGTLRDCLIYNCGGKGIVNNAFDWHLNAVDIGLCQYGYSQEGGGGINLWAVNMYQHLQSGCIITDGVGSYMNFLSCSFDTNQRQGVIIDNNNALDVQTSLIGCAFTRNSQETDNAYDDIELVDANSISVIGCTFRDLATSKPKYTISFSGTCGPVLWNGNHYQTSGGNTPWGTDLTNDYSKIVVAGDRRAQLVLTSDGGLRANKLKGSNTNDNAVSGEIGEYVTANASAVAMTSGVAKTIASISLTPGDWDVSGLFQSNPAGSTTQSYVRASVSLVNNTQDFNAITQLIIAVAAGNGVIIPTPTTRVSIASTTTIYLVAEVAYAVSTLTGTASIRARRAR